MEKKALTPRREIKFRIAHYFSEHEFSHFTYWGTIDYKQSHSDGDCFTSPATSSGTTKNWHEQFTGSRDKWIRNELYDGDIITHSSRNGGKPHPIRWSYEKGGWVGDYGLEYLIAPELMEIEKVGNIHEHPSLLPANLAVEKTK